MVDTQKRMIMAIVASFIFLMFWSKYFGPKPLPQKEVQTQTQQDTSQSTSVTPPTESIENLSLTKNENDEETKPVKPLIESQKVLVDFEKFDAVIDNHRGSVSAVTLHEYKKELKENASGVPVVPMALPVLPPMTWNFDLTQDNQTHTFTDETTTYEWIERGENGQYRLRATNGLVEVEKTYTWDPKTYQVHQAVLLINKTNNRLMVNADTNLYATKDPNNESKKGFFSLFQAPKTPVRVVSLIDEDVERFEFKDIFEGDEELPKGGISWAGFESQYFLLSLMPKQGLWKGLELTAADEQRGHIKYIYAPREIKPQSTLAYELSMYAGPKDIGILTSIDDNLKHSIDLGGWLAPISRLILRALRMLFEWFGNYGIAIIILTVIVRLMMFPLAQKQAKSMKKMQEHKPQMDALKEQYGDDKEAYSRALMEYMRSNKINPAGGCFPLLIQLPIFFALYRVLYNSIELRHTPFVGWIHDLSAHDPFFVLPALVGITFFFQTKLNPTPGGDPTTQAMMKFMPIMFSVLMIFLPSGLNLYIFVSTLWGIVQQYWVQKSK